MAETNYFYLAGCTMKKSLNVLVALILCAVFFLAGARFNQSRTHRNNHDSVERQILHYVDPMNPEHTSKEPGIAPCGMPMEPVYANQDNPGGSAGTGTALSISPGSVNVNLQKQQVIGVQVGEVTKTTETTAIRALGRIVPDENRVYALKATIEGWLEEINGATTGSLISENQLLAQIRIYNYDFFTWQQRYLTELGYTNRISVDAAPLSTTNQSRRRVMSGAGYEAGLPIPESEARLIKRGAVIARLTHETEQQQQLFVPATGSITENEPGSGGRESDLQYNSKGRLELLNFGVEESQITTLADKGTYITHVDIRSPVNGYVVARNVSPRQKIDSGTECFRIADLGQVWVEADIYDLEAKYIQPGMEAKISLPKQKMQFPATVSEVPPRFDPASRSLKVRLTLNNPGTTFRPDMFVDVEFLVRVPESISVPVGAVIDSGKRKTVYVVKEEGIFEPRAVVTGWQLNDRVEIVEGLQPGEKIVISSNFLIDSESRMKLAAERLTKDTPQQPVNTPVPASPSAPEPQPAPPAEKSTANHSPGLPDGLTVEAEAKALPDLQGHLAAEAGEPSSQIPAHREHQHD